LDGSILKTIDIGEKQILTGLISPDGKNILVEFNEIDALSSVERYDNPAQIVQLYTIEGTRVPGFETTTVIPGTMAFSPDGNYFATNSYYDTMIWDMSGNLMNVFFRHSNMISLLTYAPDGKLIATGSVEGNVFVWDPAPRKTVEEFIESGTIETLSEEIKKEFGIDE
jgi:WD40 repeat protein